MPEYLPLGAFRQGLLPDDCRSCCWWQTNGVKVERGETAARIRHDWAAELEHDWGQVGLLAQEPAGRRGGPKSGEIAISACIHFAPSASLARFRELSFPPLPASSALLFCLRAEEDAPGWAAKRLIHKAIYELRNRGVREVYAIAHWPEGSGDSADCRFFSTELLAVNGFEPVSQSGSFCLMRVDNRTVIPLREQMETALRRVFANKPAPSPAAWFRGENGASRDPT